MDTRPIGVFDSGLGGLTAVQSLRKILPEEDLVYFGDTARVPYGGRSRETILQYARQDVRFLRSFQPKALVVACGTISTTSLDTLQAENDVPFIGVVEPACRRAVQVTRNKRVGMIATLASVRSGAYETALRRLDPDVRVFPEACPLFVPLVENGRFRRGDIVAETVAREYLAPLLEQGIDTLILGCTHYPLLRDVLADVCGPGVELVSAGEEAAFALKRFLKAGNPPAAPGEAGNLRNAPDHTGQARFFVSDRAEDFERIASVFLGEDLRRAAEMVDIDQY